MRLLNNPVFWHAVAIVSMVIFLVGMVVTRGDAYWPGIPFFATFIALLIEYLVDRESFWDRNDLEGME